MVLTSPRALAGHSRLRIQVPEPLLRPFNGRRVLRKASWTPPLRSFLSRPRTHWRDLISVLSGWKNLDSGKYCTGGAQPTTSLWIRRRKLVHGPAVYTSSRSKFLMLTGLEEDSAASLKSLPSTNQHRLISDHSQRRKLLDSEQQGVQISAACLQTCSTFQGGS